MNAHADKPCGWYGTIQQFLTLSRSEWLSALDRHHVECMNGPADESRNSAWERLFEILHKELKQLLQVKPELGNYTLIFDYELPRKRQNHPDVVILGASIFILWFLDGAEIIRADVDQVDASAHHLKQYHAEARQFDVIPILVLAGAKGMIRRDKEVLILSPDHIADFFNVQAELENKSLIDADRWMSAE
jgi:hypothetical protein